MKMKQEKFKLLVLPSVKNIEQVIQKFPLSVELTKGSFNDLEFIFKNENVVIEHKGQDLKSFSFVWLTSSWNNRDLAYAVKLYLQRFGVQYSYVEKSTSKITDQMMFALSDIRTPDTLFLGHKDLEKSLSQIERVCGYPLIVKDTKGSRGADSLLITSKEMLIEQTKKLPKHKKFLFQKYIPNDYDWGVMVVNGKVVSGEKRFMRKGEFRNNICNGGREVFFDLSEIPEQVKQMAVKISSALGLSWSRTDIIIDKNTQIPYLMEVNRRPGLTSKTNEIDGAYAFLHSKISHLVGQVGSCRVN